MRLPFLLHSSSLPRRPYIQSSKIPTGRRHWRSRTFTNPTERACAPWFSSRRPPPQYTPSAWPHADRKHPVRQFHTSGYRSIINLNDILYVAGKMDAYKFPDYRLKRKMQDPSKTPLLLVACGSFSPITFLHLRMFIMGGDYVKFNTNFELIGGYLSPVSDAYKKQGLAPAEHRYVIILHL